MPKAKSNLENVLKFKIEGMDCPDCALTIEKNIGQMTGAAEAHVDFISGILTVRADGAKPNDIQSSIQKLGYQARPVTDSGSRQTTLIISDMDCPDEERIVRKALAGMSSVAELRFNLIKKEVTIFHTGEEADLVKAIGHAGLKPVIKKSVRDGNAGHIRPWKVWSVVISTITIATGATIDLMGLSPALYRPILLVGMIIGGWQIAVKGVLAARRFRLDMNFLMSAAVIGATLIGQWLEAGTVVVLFALAQLLESFSLEKSRRAISGLMDLSPRTATLLKDGQAVKVAIDEIRIDDIVLVKPGERIPVDGEIVAGSSSINQAAITGEAIPISRTIGDKVFAGTLNFDGALEIRTHHAPGDTTLDHIIHLVEEAQARRAPSQNFVDRFSTYYTPSVVAIAVLIAIVPPLAFGAGWVGWIYRALALLVIACPCALVISTPITIVSALANAARNGVLVKGGAILENVCKTSAIAFDKTGTITHGRPVVLDVQPLNGAEPDEVIRLAASVEARSEHPIADAIINYAHKNNIAVMPVTDFQAIPGQGASGSYDGLNALVGNPALFRERGLLDDAANSMAQSGGADSSASILVGANDRILGVIRVADEIRSESAGAVAALRAEGIEHIALLTGDNRRAAETVAHQIGADEVYSELLPAAKVEQIKALRNKYASVAMVGDGVNDAPALAASTTGIAMGVMGSDSALETADIALMADELKKIPWVLRLSRKTRSIIIQNIALSISIKFIFVILASVGMATLWMAVFADMGVSLMVIFNGMRALRSE